MREPEHFGTLLNALTINPLNLDWPRHDPLMKAVGVATVLVKMLRRAFERCDDVADDYLLAHAGVVSVRL
jgi:hypothetical protein